MIYPLTVAFLVAIPSVFLIRMIERSAERIRGGTLSMWRRFLIPLPIVLFLVANIDGVLSLLAYLDTHPGTLAARYSENQAWNADRFFYAGIVAAACLPFVLVAKAYKSPGFIFRVWAGQALWILVPYGPLLMASGVPLAH